MVVRPLRSLAGPAVTKRRPVPADPDSCLAHCRPASSFKSHRPKALVGDDARALLLLMSNTLRTAGYEVATARTGRQAIERAREFRPDVVLLDIGMPEMDGISACRIIRREADNPDLPIVMVTGLRDEVAIRRAFRAGATGFITKPFDWSDFEHRIDGFLSGRQHEGDGSNTAMTGARRERDANGITSVDMQTTDADDTAADHRNRQGCKQSR